MLKSSLCDYSDAYILIKGKITITGGGDDASARQADERDNSVAFKIVLHSPNDNLADAESFKSKIQITGKTPLQVMKKMLK